MISGKRRKPLRRGASGEQQAEQIPRQLERGRLENLKVYSVLDGLERLPAICNLVVRKRVGSQVLT